MLCCNEIFCTNILYTAQYIINFSEDSLRNYSGESKGRPARTRTMVRSEANDFSTKRNHSDNLNDENVGVTDNGSDSTVS